MLIHKHEKRLIVIKNAESHHGRKKNKNPHSDLKQ